MTRLAPLFFALLLAYLSVAWAVTASASEAPRVRLKDIADFEGVRSNMLIGYGLVVGLNGTGDSANSVPFTRQTLINMLEKMGVNSRAAEAQMKTKNVAGVMVTADMSSFARQGSRMDVTISSLGDAGSLAGGQLLATPLMAADGNTYAVAQGPVILGGFTVEGKKGTESKNHPTGGRISGGAIVEMETGFELAKNGNKLRLILRNPDFTTAERVKEAVQQSLLAVPATKAASVTMLDNATVDIVLPASWKNGTAGLIQKIETLEVQPDVPARIVIDEKTGTIVMGSDVRISDVAISHANLTVRVTELEEASQPTAPLGGETKIVEKTDISVTEDAGQFSVMRTGVSLADLVDALNTLGVKPRDVISILQTIKAAGALQAEIVLL